MKQLMAHSEMTVIQSCAGELKRHSGLGEGQPKKCE